MEATLQEWNLQKEKKGALLGAAGSIEARKRLIFKQKKLNQFTQKKIGIFCYFTLDEIIRNEPDALHAMNLHRLLTKNWTEYPKAYKICSKIPKSKQKRLKEILNDNRYYP